MRSWAAVVLLTSLAGCASARGFDRGALSDALAASEPVTEADIQRVLELRPQLPHPFKLGIYFRPRPDGRSRERVGAASSWTWHPSDKQRLIDVGRALEQDGIVSETVFVSAETGAGRDLRAIRLAAARHGVDAVLVVNGVADTDRYNNALGMTYVLIVTPLFVPGTVVDALFVSHAALWDVRNEYLYAAAEADGEASQTRPAALVHEPEVVEQARANSIDALAASIAGHARNLAR